MELPVAPLNDRGRYSFSSFLPLRQNLLLAVFNGLKNASSRRCVKLAVFGAEHFRHFSNSLRSFDILTAFFISVFNQLDAQNLFHNKFYCMPLNISSTCAQHHEVKIVLHSLWYHHTYRCDDGCVMQFWPPDDEHMYSKHVDAWNKTYCETNFVHQVG